MSAKPLIPTLIFAGTVGLVVALLTAIVVALTGLIPPGTGFDALSNLMTITFSGFLGGLLLGLVLSLILTRRRLKYAIVIAGAIFAFEIAFIFIANVTGLW